MPLPHTFIQRTYHACLFLWSRSAPPERCFVAVLAPRPEAVPVGVSSPSPSSTLPIDLALLPLDVARSSSRLDRSRPGSSWDEAVGWRRVGGGSGGLTGTAGLLGGRYIWPDETDDRRRPGEVGGALDPDMVGDGDRGGCLENEY